MSKWTSCWNRWIRDNASWNFRQFAKCLFTKPDPPIPPEPPHPIPVEVCVQSGILPNPYCYARETEYYLPEDAPTETCSHAPVFVCAGTRLLPNPFCPAKELLILLDYEVPDEVCTLHAKPTPVCPNPYHKGGKLRIFVGAVLTELSIKDGDHWKEADYPRYLDALVEDGINAIRSFSYFNDDTPEWDSFKPGRDGQAYWDALRRRLKMIEERDLTAIITLVPYYQDDMADEDVRLFVRFLYPFVKNVVLETENEPSTNDRQERILAILKEMGWPINHIQLGYHDSGAFGELVLANPGILSCCHDVGTMETVNSPETYGWANSPGTMQLMSLGMYGSNDGADSAGAADGPYFYQGNPKARRPSVDQLRAVTRWMMENGIGYEHLSSAGFARTTVPHLNDAIELGRAERLAMSQP